MSINEKLKNYISNKGIKQSYVAERTGISPKKISKILRGERKASADEFLKICVALEVNPNVFL